MKEENLIFKNTSDENKEQTNDFEGCSSCNNYYNAPEWPVSSIDPHSGTFFKILFSLITYYESSYNWYTCDLPKLSLGHALSGE